MVERNLELGKASFARATTEEHFLLRVAKSSALRNSMLLLVLAAVWMFFFFAAHSPGGSPRDPVCASPESRVYCRETGFGPRAARSRHEGGTPTRCDARH